MAQPTISLQKQSTGAAVSLWQDLLTKAGFLTEVTGKFDLATDQHTRAWQSSKGLESDGVVGPKSWAAMTGQPEAKTYPPYYATHAAFGRDVLAKVYTKVTGEQPTLPVLQILGAQAHLESLYGKSSYKLLDHKTGATLKTSGPINNWGAVQTSDASQGFLATDTSPLKKTPDNPKGYYDHYYRVYATPEEGAEHFVKHMTVLRPTSWQRMKEGDIDGWAQQAWAGYLPSGALNKDPVSGTLGYFEQAPSQRAKGIEERVWAISDTLGEPIAAKRGGPVQQLELPPSATGGGAAKTALGGVVSFLFLAIGTYLVGRGLGRW